MKWTESSTLLDYRRENGTCETVCNDYLMLPDNEKVSISSDIQKVN